MELLPCQFDEREKVWCGPSKDALYHKDAAIGNIIYSTMKNWPNNICQISDTDTLNSTVTSGQIITWAVRIAQYFKAKGIAQTDVIGIAGRNTTYVMPLAIACLMNANPFHAVNPLQSEVALKHLFEITKPKWIFCDGENYQKMSSISLNWKPEICTLSNPVNGVLKIEDFLQPTKTELLYKPERPKLGGEQTVAILCSSGTTGLPKAVCITNKMLMQDNFLLNSETIIYTPSGLDWLTGLLVLIISATFGCKRIISTQIFSAEYFVDLVKRYKINYTLLPPRYLSAVVNYAAATAEIMASINLVSVTGGLVTRMTLDRAQKIFSNALISSIYGMTEIGTISVSLGIAIAHCAGRPLPGVKLRIVNNDKQNVGHNDVGEVQVYREERWAGYYNNPIQTKLLQDDNGWFHTGDLGYVDNNNTLHILDRIKDILKYQGIQYWPTEIEKIVAELPEVQDVTVFGIYNEKYGDAAGALVVKRQNCGLSAEQVQQHVKQRLPSIQYQLHSGVCFVESLPETLNGKSVRHSAREIFLSQQSNKVI